MSFVKKPQNLFCKFFGAIHVYLTLRICTTALIWFDSPYNVLPDVPWEYQLSVPYLSTIMKQVNASQMGQWHIFAIMHKPLDCHIVHQSFDQEGYANSNATVVLAQRRAPEQNTRILLHQ